MSINYDVMERFLSCYSLDEDLRKQILHNFKNLDNAFVEALDKANMLEKRLAEINKLSIIEEASE